ncbi:MAG: sigma-54 dependent transcriptional regulator [Nitrospirota bacterium]
MTTKLLIIDDDQVFCKMLTGYFQKEYGAVGFSDPEDAVKYMRGNSIDVVLTDLNMPKIDGIEMLQIVKSESFDADVIIMTAYAQVETAVEAMRKGAYDYIIKPFDTDELSLQLRNLFEKRRLAEENLNLRTLVDTMYRPEDIIGESGEMKDVYRLIEKVSQSDVPVLITGESGTGKELAARAIHFSGRRKTKTLVSANCSAIPETLLESEFFGYAKGAFTGAVGYKKGLFEYADGGTIFLDEIADMPVAIQGKVLRVIQEGSFKPLGSNKEITVDVRVICATNRDLREMIRENKFREDLFYRINVLTVPLPPLRKRAEDIPLLVKRFLEGRKKIHPSSLTMLYGYEWPGNVRELKNLIERLVTLTDDDTIMPEDIPPEIGSMAYIKDIKGESYSEIKNKVINEFNRSIINRYLVKYDGNVLKAAEALKLDRANFQRLMRKSNISSSKFRETA